jgi:hypothetical protein
MDGGIEFGYYLFRATKKKIIWAAGMVATNDEKDEIHFLYSFFVFPMQPTSHHHHHQLLYC